MREMPLQHRTSIGPYQALQFIGPGPVSRVYAGERPETAQQKVALKIFEALPLAASDEQQALQELRELAALQHPHILPILEAGLDEHILYLVSPLEASSLRQRLENRSGNLLSVKEVLAILKQIGEALYFAHQHNRVHANLKPENVLFSAQGEALLADFRLSFLALSARSVRTLSVFAAGYMAPEQFQGVATPLSDQYALACLAYQLLTGHPPFEADDFEALASQQEHEAPRSPALLQPERAPHLENVLLKALHKLPEERYPDVLAFVSALLAPPPLATLVETMVLPQVDANAPTQADEAQSSENKQEALILPAPEPGATMEAAWNAVEQAGAPTLPGNAPLISPGQAPVVHSVPRRPSQTRLSRRSILMVALVTALAICVSLVSLLFLLGPSFSRRPQTDLTAQGNSTSVSTPSQNQAEATSATTPGTVATIVISPTVSSLPPGLTPTTTPTPASGTTPTPPAIVGNGCQVGYTVSSQWNGGFVANLTITNTGSVALNGWSLVFTFAADQHVTSAWNAQYTQDGLQVTLVNMDYNGTLAPGSSATPGLQGTWNGSNPSPGAFSLNGVSCE